MCDAYVICVCDLCVCACDRCVMFVMCVYDVCVIHIKNMYTHITHTYPIIYWAPLVTQIGKESTCSAGDLDSIPGSGRSPEGGMATHCSILAW